MMEPSTETMEDEAKPELCDLFVKTGTDDMYVKQEIKMEDEMPSVTAKIQDIKSDTARSAGVYSETCDGCDVKVECDEIDTTVKLEPHEVAIEGPEVEIKEPSEMTMAVSEMKVEQSEVIIEEPEVEIIETSETAMDDPAVKLEPCEVAIEEPEVEIIEPSDLAMDDPGEVVIIESDDSSEMAMDEHDVEIIEPSEMKLEDSEMWVQTPGEEVATTEPQQEIEPSLLQENFSQDLRCKLCQKDFDFLVDIIVHFDTMHTDVYETKYNCYYCKDQFRYKDQQSHYETSHPHLPPLCPICDQSCGDWQNRDLHYQCHFRGPTKQATGSTVSDQPLHGIYNCEDCLYSFPDWSPLKEHLRQEHSLDVPLLAFTCPICEAPYRSFEGLDKHYPNHFIETKHVFDGCSYTCNICKCLFHYQGSAMKHVRMQHGKQLLLVDCIHKVIQDAKLANRGKQEKPTNSTEGVCKICNEKVIKHKHLRRRHVFDDHRGYVMALRVPCNNCSKGETLIFGNLRSHHEKRHKGLCYRCKWCGQYAPTWLALETHIAEHFFDSTTSLTSEPDFVPVRKRKRTMYECRECQQVCKDWSDLRRHLTFVHSFNIPCKPFTCPECKCTYSTYSGMNGHFINHLVRKSRTWTSYECKICKWKAFTLQAVISHIKSAHAKSMFKHPKCMTQVEALVEIQEKARMAKINKLKGVQHQGTHSTKKQTPVERYQCVKCHHIAKDWINLRCHLSGAHGLNIPASPFTCCLCSSSCSTWKSLVDHFLDHFVEDVSGELEDQVQCTLCQNPFESHKDATNHLLSKHGSELMTEKNKMTLQVQLCEIQEQAMEKIKSSLQCEQCQEGFSEWSELGKHLSQTHSLDIPDKPFLCPKCKASFADWSSLYQHFINHFVAKRTVDRPTGIKHIMHKCILCKNPQSPCLKADCQSIRRHMQTKHITELQEDHNLPMLEDVVTEIQKQARVKVVDTN